MYYKINNERNQTIIGLMRLKSNQIKMYKNNVYPRDSVSNIEMYNKSGNKEVYLTKDNSEHYAFDPFKKEEIYANDNGVHYYARNLFRELYAIDLENDMEKFITLNKTDKYCTHITNDVEYYPRNFIGGDKVAKNQEGNFFYAKLEQKEYYPLDEYGNEFVVQMKDNSYNFIIHPLNHQPIAPLKRNGFVSYKKDRNREIPYEYKGKKFIGCMITQEGQYPTDVAGGEYYPHDDNIPLIAFDKNKFPKYALDKSKKYISYPRNINGDFYIEDEMKDSYKVLKRYASKFPGYAMKSNNKFIYPLREKNKKTTEMIMSDTYAYRDNVEYYPRDSNDNEYVNSKCKLLDRYPQTVDGYIIIPNCENKPFVKPSDTHLIKEIKCLLFRPDFNTYDFLLNCSSTKYTILHFHSFTLSNFNYIIAGLCTIIFILCFILFFIK